jgi:hypothetical protein
MDRREWMWSANWVGNVPPTNPTVATLSFQTFGQTVTGRLEAARTVGGLSLGSASATVNHTVDLNSNTLTVAGNIADAAYGTVGFTFTNGTLQLGSASATGNVYLTGSTTTLKLAPGAKLNTYNVGTIQLADKSGIGGWGNGNGILDLRGVEVVGGKFSAGNLLLHCAGDGNYSYLYLDGNTSIGSIEVTNSLVIGQQAGGGTVYIGNPADSGRLPPNVSVKVGVSPTQRGSMMVTRIMSYVRSTTSKLVASGGGTFTGYLTDLTLVKQDANAEAGNVNAQTGILDLGKMTSCLIDTTTLNIAPDRTGAQAPTNTDNLIGTLNLPPGNVVAGTVVVGGATNSGVATLTLSNTIVAVTNAITLHKTARVTVNVGAQSSGLVVSNSADTAFSMATATNGALRIVFQAKPAASPFYGLAWAGDHVTAVLDLQTAGKLVVDSTGLAPKTAEIFKSGGFTYVGVPLPAGTTFKFR